MDGNNLIWKGTCCSLIHNLERRELHEDTEKSRTVFQKIMKYINHQEEFIKQNNEIYHLHMMPLSEEKK